MRSRPKKPKIDVIKERHNEKVASLMTEIQEAKDAEERAGQEMIAAKGAMAKVPKNKLAEEDSDALMNKLFQAIEDLKDTNTALKELEVRLEVLREQVPLALELKVKVPVIIAQTNKGKGSMDILLDFHHQVNSTSFLDENGFPMISVEDKEKFERNTDYEIWNSDSSEAEDESQSNRELRKHVYKWIAMCLRGGNYYYIVAMYNNQKIQYDVARLYNTVVQLIGKVGTHEANRRVQRVHRATMEPNETLIQFISRLQYMAERAAEIIKGNVIQIFLFRAQLFKGSLLRMLSSTQFIKNT